MPSQQGSHVSPALPLQKRDFAIDNLKGVLIILVLLGHGGLLTRIKSPVCDFLQGLIYLFHMPLFFALSGLFVKEFSWSFFAKRFAQLMIPFYFFVIINPEAIILRLFNPPMGPPPLLFGFSLKVFIKQVFVSSGWYLQSALWFLPTLFAVNILMSVWLKYLTNKFLAAIFLLISLAVLFFARAVQLKHYTIPYGLDVAFYLLPFLMLARYLYIKREFFLRYNPAWFAAAAVVALLPIVYFVPKDPPDALTGRLDLDQFSVPDTLWGYAMVFLFSILIFLFFMHFRRKSIFSTVGLYTLPIFLLNSSYWFYSIVNLPPGWYLLIDVTGNVVLCIAISKLLIKISNKFRFIGMVA
jgi:fucose 4-O-acetylase-like acetyltransferase